MITEQKLKEKLETSNNILLQDLKYIEKCIETKSWDNALDGLNDLQNMIIGLITCEEFLKMEL
jgi:pterin-4a-carbinolamine dehydratase